MPEVGSAVLEETAARDDGVVNGFATEERADRLVARTQPLGERHHVGNDAFILEGPRAPRKRPMPAHHLVEDQQDAVAVARSSRTPA